MFNICIYALVVFTSIFVAASSMERKNVQWRTCYLESTLMKITSHKVDLQYLREFGPCKMFDFTFYRKNDGFHDNQMLTLHCLAKQSAMTVISTKPDQTFNINY